MSQTAGPWGVNSYSAKLTQGGDQYFKLPDLVNTPHYYTACLWYYVDAGVTRGSQVLWSFDQDYLILNEYNSETDMQAVVFLPAYSRGVWPIPKYNLVNEAVSSKWVHLCMGVGPRRLKVWINGTQAFDDPEAIPITDYYRDRWIANCLGGTTGDSGHDQYGGALDEVRIYNKFLTDAEVSAVYAFRGDATPTGIEMPCPLGQVATEWDTACSVCVNDTTTRASTASTTTTPVPTTTTPTPTASTLAPTTFTTKITTTATIPAPATTTTTTAATTTAPAPFFFVRFQVTSARDPALFTAGILAQYKAAIASMAGVPVDRITITLQAQTRRLLTGTVLVINIAADTSADALAIATRVTQPNLNAALSSAGLASLTYDTNSLYVTAPSITTTGAAAPGTTGQTIIFTPPPSSSSGSIVAPLAIAGACCALLLLTISSLR